MKPGVKLLMGLAGGTLVCLVLAVSGLVYDHPCACEEDPTQPPVWRWEWPWLAHQADSDDPGLHTASEE